jgi:hypothetical protein
MKTIRPLLLATTSVDSVEQTKKTKESGRWNVLVNKLHFETAKESIRVILEKFDTTTPAAQSKLPPGWTKWSDKLTKNDNDSVGEKSFLTMSAHSFASMITDADRENESIQNGVEFDMSLVTQVNKNPAQNPVESNNNEVSNEILLLRAQLKKQEEVIKRMEDKMTQMSKQTPVQQDEPVDESEEAPTADAMDTEATPKQPSRMDTIEMKFDRMINAFSNFQRHQEQQFQAFQDSHKRTKDDMSTAASSLDHASKKTDNKSTPTKPARSPSLAKAMEDQP